MSDLFGLVTARTPRNLSDFDNNAFCCSDPHLAQGLLSLSESSAFSPTLSERVSTALNLLKDRRKGVLGASWTKPNLSPADYDSLWTVLATDLPLKGYMIDKVRLVVLLSLSLLGSGLQRFFHRYDWSPHDSTLTVRMPSFQSWL
jgi:hypothetical protein